MVEMGRYCRVGMNHHQRDMEEGLQRNVVSMRNLKNENTTDLDLEVPAQEVAGCMDKDDMAPCTSPETRSCTPRRMNTVYTQNVTQHTEKTEIHSQHDGRTSEQGVWTEEEREIDKENKERSERTTR